MKISVGNEEPFILCFTDNQVIFAKDEGVIGGMFS